MSDFELEEELDEAPHGGRLHSVEAVMRFALAGNARLTLKSERTGKRYTFRIRRKDEESPYFVSLLTGTSNENDYTFIGSLLPQLDSEGKPLDDKPLVYVHSKKSKIKFEAGGPQAFHWFWVNVADRQSIPDKLEVWHEGRCGRCGRVLTVPSSIEHGIGPECETAMRVLDMLELL